MALQVWLPFTDGTLKQQGLSSSTVTQTGTINLTNTGKLGKCATFTTTAGRLNLPTSVMTSFAECSVTLWLNVTAWNTGWDTIFQAGLGSTAWNNYIFGILRNNNSTLACTISNGSTTSSGSYVSSTLSTGTWIHLAFTYSTGKIKIYINGTLDKEYSTSIVPNFAGITYITIGNTNSSSYQCNCKMNDFRIYDHCLSPMEVKELSKGLVLHYPLNREGWGQENLFNWSNNATGITLYDYQNVGSFTQFTNSLSFDPSTTVGKKYTISFWAKSPNGTTSLLLYNSNSKPKYFNFSTTLTSNLGTEWQFFKYTVTNTQYTGSDASTNTSIWKRIEIYAPSQMKVQVKQIKVEEGEIATPWCPNSSDALATTIGLNSTTEYDCSGFCNNGTRTGTFTWTSDTPKYNVSQYFQDYTRYISCSVNGWTPTALTLSCWVKSSNKSPRGNWHIPLNIDGQNAEISIYKNGQITTGFVIGGTRRTGNFGSVDILDSQWHMLTVTFDGNTIKSYIDAVLIESRNYSGALSSMNTVYLGIFGGNNTYANTQLYQSDSRIYATALSADDVKSLYQNSAYIDSSGNVYGAVHSEV